MSKGYRALGNKVHPLGMLIVGMLFIPLGIYQYPAFIIVGILYVFIGLRGLSNPAKPKPVSKRSDKAQFESL